MMSMNLPIIFSLSLIGMALGAMLIVKAKKHKDVGTAFPKFIGYVVVIFSLINLVCAGFCTFTFIKMEENTFNGVYSLMTQKNSTFQSSKCPCKMKDSFQSTKCPCTAKANQNKEADEPIPMNDQMQQQHMDNSMMQDSSDAQEHMDDMPMHQDSDTEN